MNWGVATTGRTQAAVPPRASLLVRGALVAQGPQTTGQVRELGGVPAEHYNGNRAEYRSLQISALHQLHVQTVDAIAGGWVPDGGRLAGLPGVVLVGEYRAGALRYIGTVGTGWSDREREQLAKLLRVAAWPHYPFQPVPRVSGAHWVLPRLVAEIGYTARTRSGLLRHPWWYRLAPSPGPRMTAARIG